MERIAEPEAITPHFSSNARMASFMKWFGEGILHRLALTISPVFLIYTVGWILLGSLIYFVGPNICYSQIFSLPINGTIFIQIGQNL